MDGMKVLFAKNGPYTKLLLRLTSAAAVFFILDLVVVLSSEEGVWHYLALLLPLPFFTWYFVWIRRNWESLKVDWNVHHALRTKEQTERRQARQVERQERAERARELERLRNLERQRHAEQAEEAERQREIERQRQRLYSISDMLAATPKQFEHMVERILRRQGYNLVVVGGAGDQGVDLRGTGPDGAEVIVQCKRQQQQSRIAPKVIRELAGSVGMQRAEVGIFVTTTWFSESARVAAADAHVKLILVDANLLTQLAGSDHWQGAWEGG